MLATIQIILLLLLLLTTKCVVLLLLLLLTSERIVLLLLLLTSERIILLLLLLLLTSVSVILLLLLLLLTSVRIILLLLLLLLTSEHIILLLLPLRSILFLLLLSRRSFIFLLLPSPGSSVFPFLLTLCLLIPRTLSLSCASFLRSVSSASCSLLSLLAFLFLALFVTSIRLSLRLLLLLASLGLLSLLPFHLCILGFALLAQTRLLLSLLLRCCLVLLSLLLSCFLVLLAFALLHPLFLFSTLPRLFLVLRASLFPLLLVLCSTLRPLRSILRASLLFCGRVLLLALLSFGSILTRARFLFRLLLAFGLALSVDALLFALALNVALFGLALLFDALVSLGAGALYLLVRFATHSATTASAAFGPNQLKRNQHLFGGQRVPLGHILAVQLSIFFLQKMVILVVCQMGMLFHGCHGIRDDARNEFHGMRGRGKQHGALLSRQFVIRIVVHFPDPFQHVAFQLVGNFPFTREQLFRQIVSHVHKMIANQGVVSGLHQRDIQCHFQHGQVVMPFQLRRMKHVAHVFTVFFVAVDPVIDTALLATPMRVPAIGTRANGSIDSTVGTNGSGHL